MVCALDKCPSSAPQSNYNSKIDLLELLLIYLDLIKHTRRTLSPEASTGKVYILYILQGYRKKVLLQIFGIKIINNFNVRAGLLPTPISIL